MSNATNYLEDKILKDLLSVASYTPPATIYVGLFTATPSDTGGGTEVTGGSYVRMSAGTWSVSGTTPTAGTNVASIEWPAATASWGTITSAALFDASTSGNMLIWLPLVDPADMTTPLSKTISTGDIFRIAASQLRVRCD